ncbi:MAG: TonB-dependent receptor [Chlorobi bacterium]|nr:MAG: TonB-dependent receptor [Bacteroidota bacterium]KXK33101.1 MAG: TonB-dependent receptor [Chlorobi bacterium OLB6]MBL1161812.1 TonB-dependent receptor [Chlorobiota bacterium]MBW7853478.1 TonB-dependent receptor [Candidatus Kapabacteria bacterium]MCC6331599.1 TonB-dependent receptor [Ignavibacteria bacterium]
MLTILLASMLLIDSVLVQPVTVTATRLPTEAYRTGRSISVLTADDINALPVQSVDELLRFIPGIEIQSRGPLGTQSDISIRGSTFNQVLVMVDGMRVNDPLTGHYSAYLPVSLAEVHHIEVLRGPAAALYGVDAVGGVINIVTHTFAPEQSRMDTTRVMAGIGAGEHGLFHGDAGVLHIQGNSLVSGGLQTNTSTGFKVTSTDNNGDFTMQTASASVRNSIADNWEAAIRLGTDARDFDAQHYYSASTQDQSRETVTSLWLQTMLQHSGSSSNTRFDVSYKRLTDRFQFNPTFSSTNLHTTQMVNFLVNSAQEVTNAITLGWGLQADYRDIKSTDRGNHSAVHGGVYATAQLHINNLVANGSIRTDADENYGLELTPQLSASYSFGSISLRSSIARGVRGADFTERYVSHNLPGILTPNRNYGNPDLDAESSWTWDAGFDWYAAAWMHYHVSVFRRTSSNLIDYILVNSNTIEHRNKLAPDTTYLYPENLAAVTISGLEGEVAGLVVVGGGLTADYSVGLRLSDTKAVDGIISKYLSTASPVVGSAIVNLKVAGTTLSLQTLYKKHSDEFMSTLYPKSPTEYTIANASLRYRLSPAAECFVLATNMFNTPYEDIPGVEMPARWISGGIKVAY